MDEPKPDLLVATLRMLESRRGQWVAVCQATGLNYSWLTKLAQGQITNPTIQRLQTLHDHLVALDRSETDAAA